MNAFAAAFAHTAAVQSACAGSFCADGMNTALILMDAMVMASIFVCILICKLLAAIRILPAAFRIQTTTASAFMPAPAPAGAA